MYTTPHRNAKGMHVRPFVRQRFEPTALSLLLRTPANSCGFLRTADCVGICVACQRHSQLSRRKTRLCVILLGELCHLGNEWQSEAGGGKTFCLSAFLEVVRLGRFSTCHSLPPIASIWCTTFCTTFCTTVQKRTLTATTGQKGFELLKGMGTMARLNVKVVPGSSRNQIVG